MSDTCRTNHIRVCPDTTGRLMIPQSADTSDNASQPGLRRTASRSAMEMHLANLLHRKIVVLGPHLPGADATQDKLETVTLVGVDPAGIWIESEEAANRLAERFRVKPAAPSAFFIPFAQITTILASQEAAASAEPPQTTS